MGGRSSSRAATLLASALAGEESALEALVDCLTPPIQERVAWTLIQRRPPGGAYDIREHVNDLTQEVFMALFANDAKTLRSWDPERGLSLERFAGLVAERRATSVLRSSRRNPWKEQTTDTDQLDRNQSEGGDPEVQAAAKELYDGILDRLRMDLSPLGWHLFELLFVHGHAIATIQESTGLSSAAIYAWRSRLRKRARALADEMGTAERPPLGPTKAEVIHG